MKSEIRTAVVKLKPVTADLTVGFDRRNDILLLFFVHVLLILYWLNYPIDHGTVSGQHFRQVVLLKIYFKYKLKKY